MEMDVFLWIIPSMPPIPPAKAPLRFYGKGFLSDEVAGDDWGMRFLGHTWRLS